MAIIKQHEVKGVSANYWRITNIGNISIEHKKVAITVGLYKDKATREEDVKNVLFSESRVVDVDNLDGNIREQAYVFLMANEPNGLIGRIDFTQDAVTDE